MRTRHTAVSSTNGFQPVVVSRPIRPSPDASVWLVFDAGGELFNHHCALESDDELIGVAA